MITAAEKRVLSIQSHVVVGHVGNRAATVPLIFLGWECDILNTVQFSNHTGPRYGRWAGRKMDREELVDIFNAMDSNGLLRQSHLLTGYVPSPESLEAVSSMVDRLRELNPNLVYILDPVLGDSNKIYVHEKCIDVYKTMLPKATCATPNHFEAELLTDIKITSLHALKAALDTFHNRYNMPNIVISSTPSSHIEGLEPGFLVCAGSSRPLGSSVSQQFTITFPALPEHYEGVGDVFSALILAHFAKPTPSQEACPLSRTAEIAIATLAGILTKTRSHALQLARDEVDITGANPAETPEERIKRMALVELRLVQSHKEITEPATVYKAVPLV
jgi:pyridoxine kinase